MILMSNLHFLPKPPIPTKCLPAFDPAHNYSQNASFTSSSAVLTGDGLDVFTRDALHSHGIWRGR